MQTIQPHSQVFLNEPGKNLTANMPEAEDNMALLLSVYDSLNKLYEKLNKLNFVIQRKKIEQNIPRKGREMPK